jgi:hypothetical protein
VGGVIALLSISYLAFMPVQTFSQNRIECTAPGNCNGWLYHNNKIGIGSGWSEAFTPRTTLHLHEFSSANTFLNITNNTTGFPSGNQTLGLWMGMTGNKAVISNFQNDNIVIATGTTERLIITPTGNTGIGITTPQNVLHIHKSIGTIPQLNTNDDQNGIKNMFATSAYGIQITNNNTGTATGSGLLIGLTSSGNARIIHQQAMNLSLGVNNNDVLTINTSNNVGIGISTPTAKLHTKGTVRFENLTTTNTYANEQVLLIDAQGNLKQGNANLIADNFGNHTATQNIKLNDNWLSNDGASQGIKINNLGDVLIFGTTANGSKTFEQNNGFEIVTRGRIPERRGISVDEDANGIPNGNVNFWIHNWQNPAAFNFMRNDVGSTKKLMTITKSGNVGINTDNPTANLHVAGTLRFEQLPQQQTITNEAVLISDNQGNIKTSAAAQLKDNLGNHTATQNIKLSNYWLSNDGSDKGVQIKPDGNVQVGSGITQINIGKSYTSAPNYLSSYIGFNVQRNEQGQWVFQSDGANNGGTAIITDVAGNLRFVSYKPQQGSTITTISESELMANSSLLITSNNKIGLRTTNINTEADVQIKGTTYIEDRLGIGICLGANNNPKGYRFAVNGTMGAKDVYIEVDETPWPDYVFEPEYRLMPLSELEWYINQNKHLPDIPSANDIKENGLSLAEINAQLVKKVEELTLYIIELNKKMEKYESK